MGISKFGLENYKRMAVAVYDFKIDGGKQGEIAISSEVIPKGAVITNGFIHVFQEVTSEGNATIALRVKTANDVKAATAKGDFSVDALIACEPKGTVAKMIKANKHYPITMTIAGADLTAGRFAVVLEYAITS